MKITDYLTVEILNLKIFLLANTIFICTNITLAMSLYKAHELHNF